MAIQQGTRQLVRATALAHTYEPALARPVRGLAPLDLALGEREVVAVAGPSGSGKTTLIRLLGAEIRPNQGELTVAGYDLVRMSTGERERYRLGVVGCKWQDPGSGLWPDLTVLENVQLPLLAGAATATERLGRATELIDALGLRELRQARAGVLGATETARLALAVALANGPLVLLADEPTAGLDRAASNLLLGDLGGLLSQLGVAAVLTHHEPELCRYADRTVLLPASGV